MRIASLADVKAKLSSYVREAEAEGSVVITRNGRAVALLLAPADDDDLERLILSRSPRFGRLLEKSRASLASGRGLTSREFWKAAKRPRSARPAKAKAA